MYIEIENEKLEKFTGKKLMLFGASSTGVKAVEELERIDAKILGFCDNGEKKWGMELEGYKIYSPSQLKEICNADPSVCIMITSTYEKEIKEQLQHMHLSNVYVVHMGVLHSKQEYSQYQNVILPKKKANEKLKEKIMSGTPFFIGRVGSTELETICNYKYFIDRKHHPDIPYTKNITNMLCDWCGFFPPDHKLMDEFCQMYLTEIKTADMLWCMWESRYENKLLYECCPETELTLYDETGFPYDIKEPWTMALKGKKVLVIHPFEQSIQENYKIKDKLFTNKNFMPDFELHTLKAVQTLADNKSVPFKNWFEALESMKQKMQEIDFDVALIGAGAYGFPLGAHAKKLGKQALHIGGMLQLYFGIRGNYYDSFQYHNEYWTRPLEEEKPKGFKKVEAGRYW